MHRLRNFAALLAPNDGPVPGGVPPPSGGIGTPPAPAPAPAPVPVPVLAPAPAPTPPDDRLIKLEAENAALRKENERLKPAPVRPTKDGEVPADVLDRIAKLEASNSAQAMELALEKAGIKDPKQRELVALAAQAKPPADLNAFVAQYAPAAPAVVPAAPAIPPAQRPPSSNTGAPGPVGGALPITDLKSIGQDGSMFKALPLKERLELSQRFRAGDGHVNPFRRIGK